jgi:hypothetical protein
MTIPLLNPNPSPVSSKSGTWQPLKGSSKVGFLTSLAVAEYDGDWYMVLEHFGAISIEEVIQCWPMESVDPPVQEYFEKLLKQRRDSDKTMDFHYPSFFKQYM